MIPRAASTAVFLFAHPDDEFGVMPEIARCCNVGEVHVVYLTDGGRTAALRRQAESLGVLSRLGVQKHQIHWIGIEHRIPDGHLTNLAAEAYAHVRAVLARIGAPCVAYAPAWEGGHPDHDVANAMVARALAEGLITRALQFPLYNGDRTRHPLFRALRPLPSNGAVRVQKCRLVSRARYISYLTRYPSQWRTWLGLLVPVALKYLFGTGPVLQMLNPTTVYGRPHQGPLYYEMRGFARYADVAAAVNALTQKSEN